MATVIAAATATMKRVNQDGLALVRNTQAQLCGIITTDGLGSHYQAEVAAHVVARSMRDHLEHLGSPELLDIPALFEMARQDLSDHVMRIGDTLPRDLDWQNAFGTTAIAAVESEHAITIGYVGNGAALHLRGDFNTFPSTQLLPWSAVNYLNPHSIPRHGKNILYKLVSPRGPLTQATPTVLTIGKDNDQFGDIIVACSDGIYSYHQVAIGKDGDGHIWISGDDTVVLLFAALKTFFASGVMTDESLEHTLAQYLDQVREQHLMNDDCTVAVLITEKAIEYQRALNGRKDREAVA